MRRLQRSVPRSLALLILTAGLLAQIGCNSTQAAAFARGFSQGMASGTKLMVFGGQGHDTYLGCLSCPTYATDSIFNVNGLFGRYATNSILNQYSSYGSKYSNYSACNPYATDPPVVVDESGTFYGRLTLNAYLAQALRQQSIITWLSTTACAG